MKIEDLILRIKRKWMKMRLQPIRVLCFHQVSDAFDESTMERVDWLETDLFKQRIEALCQEGYTFISLPEAHEKMRKDWFRRKRYAVLTADDGWASLKNILPWLNEQQIPVTLFLNPAYLDGMHYRNSDKEQYLSAEEIAQLYKQYPLVTVGMHGWEHKNATKQTEEEFRESVEKSERYLKVLPNYVPYFAYTWGRHSGMTDDMLLKRGITPVLIMGGQNYSNFQIIDRELLS